jgi:hypothetical protein
MSAGFTGIAGVSDEGAYSGISLSAVVPSEITPFDSGSLTPERPQFGYRGQVPAVTRSGLVYALGRIEPRYPNLSVEKELAQATARAETVGLADREMVQKMLSAPECAYIARQLCWVLTIEGIDTFLLMPREMADVATLVAALRPTPQQSDIDVVVGTIVGVAPPGFCNGLQLPMVSWAQIYSFDVESFIASMPRPKGIDEEPFAATIEEVLTRVAQLADNTGIADGDRAVNYLATRYPAIYQAVAEQYARNRSLVGVSSRPSPLSGARSLVDVVFTFRDRQTDLMEKLFARVDVTEVFPFLATKLSPYYDR